MNLIDLGRLRRLGLPALMITAALGLSACGDDESPSSAEGDTTTEEASAEDVTVTAVEYEFDLSATPTAETKSIEFVNDGEEGHALIFARINEGFTVDEAVKLEGKKGSAVLIGQTDSGPGETTTLEVKKPIEPGSYALLCPIPGPDGPHYKLGQLEEFEVE